MHPLQLLKNALANEFIRFLLVGGLNTLFGYGVFFASLSLGAKNALALLLANVLGVLFNFHTFGKLVFRSHDYRRIVHFTLVYAGIYTANLGILELLNTVGLESRTAQAILIIPVALASWLLNKKLVFTRPEKRDTPSS